MRFFSARPTEATGAVDNMASDTKPANETKDPITPDVAVSRPEQQDEKEIGVDLQDGVAKVEATTVIWMKRDLILVYVL